MNRFQWNYPSQGMKTARTLTEAFGPYTSRQIEAPQDPMPTSDKIVVIGSLAVLAVVVALVVFGVIPNA